MSVPIYVVDAFTSSRFSGNPAAVVLFDAYPEDALLQAIAAENNLAETAFPVRRSDGNWDLRWFTPTVKFPCAVMRRLPVLISYSATLYRTQPKSSLRRASRGRSK